MLLQHLFAPLIEAIHTPYAFDVYRIIEECRSHAKTIDDFRDLLNTRLSSFFRDKLSGTEVRRTGIKLDVHIAPPSGDYQHGGVFRAFDMEQNIVDNNGFATDGLPPVPDQTMEIWAFIDDTGLEEIQDNWSAGDQMKEILGSTLIHEFVHAIQYSRAKENSRSLNRYTVGMKRPNVDGKRGGKRGAYMTPDVSSQAYHGTAVEIEAHATSAASSIVHRVRKEPPEQQRAYLEKVLRSLRGHNSNTISTYNELFNKSTLSFFGGGGDPAKAAQTKRQKAVVWKAFRFKLARHLIDYIETLPSASSTSASA